MDRISPLDPSYQATMAAVVPVLGNLLAIDAVIAAEVARQASFLAFRKTSSSWSWVQSC